MPLPGRRVMSGPTVAEPAPRTQRRGRRAPHVGYPMCTHAYVASAFGASRLHGLLADWPRSYAEAILRTARPGWETAGAAPKRRHFHATSHRDTSNFRSYNPMTDRSRGQARVSAARG